MGCKHSGSVSNLAFANVEKIVYPLITTYAAAYIRRSDDMLVVAAAPAHRETFVKKLDTIAKPEYRIEKDEASMESIAMLDMMIFKNQLSNGMWKLM